MKAGDRVRVLKVPPGVTDDEEFLTRTIVERAVGKTFPVVEVNPSGWIGLELGEMVGKESYKETIWIEPDCVELVKSSDEA